MQTCAQKDREGGGDKTLRALVKKYIFIFYNAEISRDLAKKQPKNTCFFVGCLQKPWESEGFDSFAHLFYMPSISS